MRINRFFLFLIGFAVMLAVYFAQRAYVYQHSAFTHGMLVCDDPLDLKFYEADMTLHYYVDGREYTVEVRDDTRLAFKELQIRYPQGKPDKGRIYSTSRFWVLPALWLLIPLMLWGAFIFTYFRENSGIQITYEKKE
ncbi:MAG: hypothetical protein II757_02145 [Bacteroidales bacterium]|nr:hypothetical protein [Bacteroidales bacterium]MCR5114314.1 hypothetical protein [Bacteroidales bacterium]